MKNLKTVVIGLLLGIVILWSISSFAYQGPPTEEGAKWRQEQRDIERRHQEEMRQRENLSVRRPRQPVIIGPSPIDLFVSSPSPDISVIFELQKQVSRLSERINELEKVIKGLKKQIELNYKLEKIHWSKVIEINKQVKWLSKAKNKK